MRLSPSNNFVAIVSAAILALILGFAYGATFSDGCSEDTLALYTNGVSPNMPFHRDAFDAACLPLFPLKDAVFQAAEILFKANREEQEKVGARIAALETGLYAG
jgi:hypothetical protein